MNREAMIERLVEDDIQVIKGAMIENDVEYLNFILRDGIGFNKMTDKGIIEEFNQRTWEVEEAKEWIGTIRMRWDLIQEGLAVPASTTFSNYDTLDDDIFVTAEELTGATFGDDPADPDDHAFCYVKLKDGRSLYFMSVDLDFKN